MPKKTPNKKRPQSKDLAKFSFEKLMKKGRQHYDKQDWENAAPYYMEIWNRDPENEGILVVVAFLLSKLGVRAQAISVLEKALEVNGPTREILDILGEMATNMAMFDIGEKLYNIFIQSFPDDPKGYEKLCSCLGELERYDESLDILGQVIPIFPENTHLWSLLGAHTKVVHGPTTALQFFEEAIRLDPNNYMAHNNLAICYTEMGDYESAKKYSAQAHKMHPDHHEPLVGLGLSQIALGDIKEGYENYEHRNDPARRGAVLYKLGMPKWEGESLEGKTIFITNEQGLGDEILFSIGFRKIYEQAEQTVIGCDFRLAPVFARTYPKAAVLGSYTQREEGYTIRQYPTLEHACEERGIEIDYYVPAGSIYRFIADTPEDFTPPQEGFIEVDSDKTQSWQETFDKLDDKPKVGIVWRSGLRSAVRDKNYTEVTAWKEVLKTQGVTFVCIQYDDSTAEIKQVKDEFGVDIYLPKDLDQKNELDDTYAMIKALDLVIGPATTPTMMANSVGVPTWFLLRTKPWWFYGYEDRAPIAPNGDFFVSGYEGDWEKLLSSVAVKLEKYAKEKGSS